MSKALQQLPDDEIEKVADFAEFLAARRPAATPVDPQKRLSLDWAGGAAGLKEFYASGVDAAHDALNIMAESAERKLSR
ncbi:MAG TPA: DUF2281 domain-containing protein [Tepidisphaeraceae bacterium]|nr:DUF2281 domain-containing protein [Tepidisphaeraceae bacterium]